VDATKSSASAQPITERTRTRRCDGCGVRVRKRELVEVMPEHVAFGHGVREGERYCRSLGCARRHGVI
jgi:hypothetical protein